MDYEKIILTRKERLILFNLRFMKRCEGNVYSASLQKLYKYGLISPNYFPEQGSEGEFIPDGTYSLTDEYKRLRIYESKQRIHRYITPITLAAVTTIVTRLLEQWWLPAVINFLQGRF
jgi:hypothetical protein